MFELLFKYSRATFERGELLFASGWPIWLLIALIVGAAIAVAFSVARRHYGLALGKAITLGTLQALLIAALLVLVWRPALLTQTLRPQENTIAVLLDTSASMSYGEQGRSRLQEAVTALSDRALPELTAAFDTDLFSFAGDTIPIESLQQVPAPGRATHIGESLLTVLRGAQSGALASVILVTDGADNSNDLGAARIAEIASFGVPVHTVGVGPEVIEGDLELEQVTIPPVGLPGSRVSAQVSIRHATGANAQLKVYDGDAILASQPISLPNRAGVTTRWIDLDVGEAGVKDLRFTLDPLPGEANVVNNAQLRPMEVPRERRHILYIEGEPRWEYKFIRRAIDEQSAVRLASLLKTTPNKFYRQGVESATELADGFPTDEKTLFAYDALVIGSYEAAAFTPAQLNMIRDFVSRRGGSLLMLAGRRGLADGGWGATPVAEVLPAKLPTPDAPTFVRTPAKAKLTPEGGRSAVTRLAAEDDANRASWQELPELADFQRLDALKPGAVRLLEAEIEGKTEPLLVHQRFGLGNAYILASGGTWRWQMQLPHEDQRHETFWRQLLQALSTAAPRPVTLTADRVFYADESTVKLRAEVKDREFQPADDAKVALEVTRGYGPPSTIEMTLVPGERGVYQATYETPGPGVYRFAVSARTEAATGSARATGDSDGDEAVAASSGEPQAARDAETADAPAARDAEGLGEAAEGGEGLGGEPEIVAEAAPRASRAATEADSELLGTARFAVRREDGVAEHFRIQQNRPLLERLAEATGGQYFAVGDVSRLPEAVRFSPAGIVERQILDLWNMPIVFLLLLALKAGEWLLRLFWGRL